MIVTKQFYVLKNGHNNLKKKSFKICNCIKKKHKSPDRINLRLLDKYVTLVIKSEPT